MTITRRSPDLKKDFEEKYKKIVTNLASIGLEKWEICAILNIGFNTLQLKYLAAYHQGRAKCNYNLKKTQLEVALKHKNPSMLMYCGKVMAGQKETSVIENVSSNIQVINYGETKLSENVSLQNKNADPWLDLVETDEQSLIKPDSVMDASSKSDETVNSTNDTSVAVSDTDVANSDTSVAIGDIDVATSDMLPTLSPNLRISI